jgi:putative ABC transport system permease protein
MFRHYLTLGLRSFLRHKLYSFINIAGLAVGLACAIFITVFVREELSYDKWLPGSTDLYRLEVTFLFPGAAPVPMAQSPFPVAYAMREEIPEVRAITHITPEKMTGSVADRQFLETASVVDPNFFQVIRLPFLKGNPATALAQPESVVLSESAARKYFGNADALGQILRVSNAGAYRCDPNDSTCLTAIHPLTVTGVIRDLPHNSHLVADLVVPSTSMAEGIPQKYKDEWTSTNDSYSYLALRAGSDPGTVLAKLAPILDRSVKPKGASIRGSEFEKFHLTPFQDVHLTSDRYGGMKPPGSYAAVYGLAITAALILLLASFNFMNLATARATLRAREISMRKAVGATRGSLITQFLGEAVLTALVSLGIALVLVNILTPALDAMLNQAIELDYAANWSLLLLIIAATCIIGLLSGVYPALVLSSFRPAVGLKISPGARTGSGTIRTALVVAQFAISIGLGIAALAVFSQINFTRNLELGFDRQGIVVVRGINKMTPSARESFIHTLRTNPQVVDAALSNAVPFETSNASNDPVNIQGDSQAVTAHMVNINPEFPSVYGVRLLAGRFLARDRGEDMAGQNVLINKEALHRFGQTPDEILGKILVHGNQRLTIVGILEDVKLDGLKDAVHPAVYRINPIRVSLLSARLRGARLPDTIAFLDKTWAAFVPGANIQRYFLNDAFYHLFESEEKQGQMLGLFVFVAISIACLGLFGLTVFTAERRTREIGLRKVHGASTIDLVRLLLWQISIPVLIANLAAWPVAYYYLQSWLQGYAYHIALTPLYFGTVGAVALCIAWITVFTHAVRLARANPTHALRYE